MLLKAANLTLQPQSDLKYVAPTANGEEPEPAKGEPADGKFAAENAERYIQGPIFVASDAFNGAREGYVFKKGEHGCGYYKDEPPTPTWDGVGVVERASWTMLGPFLSLWAVVFAVLGVLLKAAGYPVPFFG